MISPPSYLFFSYIMSYETPLCIKFWLLWMCSQFQFHACCVPSAELTIKWTQRQLRSENVIISNLTMNFHHSIILTARLMRLCWIKWVASKKNDLLFIFNYWLCRWRTSELTEVFSILKTWKSHASFQLIQTYVFWLVIKLFFAAADPEAIIINICTHP